MENLEPNAEATLAYLMPPITGIAIFLLLRNHLSDTVDKESASPSSFESGFVRFHAAQSTLFGIVIVLMWIIGTFFIPYFLIRTYFGIFSMVAFIVWLMLLWKAYNNEEYELPYLGKLARQYFNR